MINQKHYHLLFCPTKLFQNNTLPLEDNGYVPFSLTHKYNKFIENNERNIIGLFGIEVIPFPFEDDDIEYTIEKSETDKIGGERYLNKTRIIN
jgi:hypothetical protein